MRIYDLFKNNISHPQYSNLSALLTYLFSAYGFLSLLLKGSILWLPSLITLFVASTILFSDMLNNVAIGITTKIDKNLALLIKTFLIMSYFISSLIGLLATLDLLALRDLSSAALPIVVFIFIFCGASIGLFQRL